MVQLKQSRSAGLLFVAGKTHVVSADIQSICCGRIYRVILVWNITQESHDFGHQRRQGDGPVLLPIPHSSLIDPKFFRHLFLRQLHVQTPFPHVVADGPEFLRVSLRKWPFGA